MKKLILTSILGAMILSSNAQVTITVDPAKKRQTIRGIGCQDDLEDPGQKNDNLIYDIGASSYRAFAGANSEAGWDEQVNDNNDPNVLDITKISDLAEPKLSAYRKAAKRGCVFFMTIGSPPAWQKTNNSCCDGGYLKSDMYEEFGEFAMGVAKKFKQQIGVDLYAINVQNEPEFQEPYYSCVYTGQQCVNAAKAIQAKFKANGITTKIFFAEQCFTQNNVMSWAKLANDDVTLTQDLCAFANHTYNSDPFGGGMATIGNWTNIYRESRRVSPIKEVWMTEGGTTGKTMDDALAAGYEFFKSMKYGNATLFSHRYLGRTSAPYNYYGIKIMVRYIRPGAYRLETACTDTFNILPLAFKRDADGAHTLYIINRSAKTKSIKVNWTGVTGKFEMYQSNNDRNCEWVKQVSLADSIILPPATIATLVSSSANKIPNIDQPDTIVIIKGASSKVVNLTGINDGGEGNQSLSVKAWIHDGSSTSMLSSFNVSYTSPNTTGTLNIVPGSALGNSKIQIAVSDKSLALDSMLNEKVISVPVYIIPFINKAPTLGDIADQTYGKELINAVQNINTSGVTDGNGGVQKLTMTVTSSNPSIVSTQNVGVTMIQLTPKAEGTVTITVTIKDDGINVGQGVGSITKTFKVVVGSGVYDLDEPDFVTNLIYPNPAHDVITINEGLIKAQSVQITNMNGEMVINQSLNSGRIINISSLKSGVYLVKVISEDGVKTQKIFVE